MLLSFCGEGSLNGKVVVENAMRWWLDSAWEVAVWRRGDASSITCDCDCAGSADERCFWRESEARRLEERKRFRDWRLRTVARQVAVFGMDGSCE